MLSAISSRKKIGISVFRALAVAVSVAGCGGGKPGFGTLSFTKVSDFNPKSGVGCPQTLTFTGTDLLRANGKPYTVFMNGPGGEITMSYVSGSDTSVIFTIPCPIAPGKYTVNFNAKDVGTYTET